MQSKELTTHCKLCLSSDLSGKNILNEFYYQDVICDDCRQQFNYRRRYIQFKGYKVQSFYIYDAMMQKALIQYKECYDEYLYDVFLKRIKNYIKLRYHGYTIVLVPSSSQAIERRGFNHLKLMFESVGLPIVELFEKTTDHSQMHSNLTQRSSIENYLKLKENVSFPKKVLVVDDVLTTGYTLNKCMDLLKKRTKKLKALTISYNKSWNIVKKGI